MCCEWSDKVFGVTTTGFTALALQVFHFQYDNNKIYRKYVDGLKINPADIHQIKQIPFLPIRFFKSQTIATTTFEPQVVFESSGTTQTINSRHLVKHVCLYEESFLKAFRQFYGPVQDWCIMGLLPSYLERNNSSLVFMVDKLVKLSGHPASGFFLHDMDALRQRLSELETAGQKTLLIGVTFGLLDFIEKYPVQLKHTTIMETGGMKGRRKEMIREELHKQLCEGFGVNSIHSEYGMTELLSQAYSKEEGIFNCPAWIKVLVREEDDPLSVNEAGRGVLNVIDLANIYSCSFIATDDAGRVYDDGSFEVMGRTDSSDLRGCSLMVV